MGTSGTVIVGEAEPAGIQRPYPVWWDTDGTLTELPGPYSGSARGVNDAGVIVGIADNDGGWAVRWESTTVPATRLTTLPSGENDSAAYDVNTDGTIVGYSRGADGVQHAVRWDAAGTISELGTVASYPSCVATDLNDDGMAVGSCAAGGARVAVRWDDAGVVAVLPALGGSFAEATGVSDAGIIVGYAEDACSQGHAVRWGVFGTVTRLATLGGRYGVAMDINNSGTVVGRTTTTGGQFHATNWRNAG